jgi:hypothetical protein
MSDSRLLMTRTQAVSVTLTTLAGLEKIASKVDATPEEIEADVRELLRGAYAKFEGITYRHFVLARADAQARRSH